MPSVRFNWSFIAGAVLASSAFSFYSLLFLKKSVANKRRKVVVFGDSITQHGWNTDIKGWVASLAFYWFRRVDIINRGYSGYNSRWGLALLDDLVVAEKPEFVTVFFGANDAVDPLVLQHVPLLEFESNIRLIVRRIKAAFPGIPIVVFTPPPIWENKLRIRNESLKKLLPVDRTNERALEYGLASMRVCAAEGVPVLDLWKGLEGESDNRQIYLSDGLHLNELGNQKLFTLFVELVEKHFPEWKVDNMPMDLPDANGMIERFANFKPKLSL